MEENKKEEKIEYCEKCDKENELECEECKGKRKKNKKTLMALIIIFILIMVLVIVGIKLKNNLVENDGDILQSVNINPKNSNFVQITENNINKILEKTELTREEFDEYKNQYIMVENNNEDYQAEEWANMIGFTSLSKSQKEEISNMAIKNFDSLQNYILLSDDNITNHIYRTIESKNLSNSKFNMLTSAVASGIIHSYFNYESYELEVESTGIYIDSSEICLVINNKYLILISYNNTENIPNCWVSIYKGTKYNDNKKAKHSVQLNSASYIKYWKEFDIIPSIDKPIIYLYPETETEVSVKLGEAEKLTCTYPKYEDEGWKVLAKPSGDLIDLKTGRNLYSLYWEGINTKKYNNKFEEGFVIKGEDTIKFLEEKLGILGLSQTEAQEFIIYWLPKMENNKYNYIKFQTAEEIEKNMPLEITPKPDTTIRVMMEWKSLDKYIEIEEQKLETPERKGFVAVEWGGTEIK